MATSSSALFNGTSRFSSDLQQVLTRAVSIASLPITQLTNELGSLQGQASGLHSLNQVFTSLQSAIQEIQTATETGSYHSSVSKEGIAQPVVSSSATPGPYTLEVVSLGSSTNTLSNDTLPTITDPATQNISLSSDYTLTINGSPTTIHPQSSSLNGLAQAINAQAGLNVQASIVNVGSSSAPDYRLTLQSQKLGPTTIQLNDGASDLLTNLNTGSLASYKVDRIPTPVTSDSSTITLAPGLTVNLLRQSTPGDPVTISVSRDASGIQDAISHFVAAFNSAVDEVNKSHGDNAGPLQGQSVIFQLGNALSTLGTFSNGSPGITSLAGLGVTFDQTGQLSLDSSVLANATPDQISNVPGFLGDSQTGGFLQKASSVLTGVEDTSSGILANALSSIQSQIANDNNLISANQARVDQLKQNLTNQIARSDAAIATLEQTYTQISGLFQSYYNSSNSNSLQ